MSFKQRDLEKMVLDRLQGREAPSNINLATEKLRAAIQKRGQGNKRRS